MSRNFPHISDTDFPNVGNVDVYQYQNDFDYKRYDYSQMDIIICAVPWDMGEAHVGNRTIDGIGNVVYFADKNERDKWFDAIPEDQCFRWSTKMRELHRTNTIDVPLPFDVASRYNYLVVRYRLFANDESPVEYEDNTGLRQWFWFIREVEFLAPNTTRLHLLNDAWQTFIYDLDISGMILERGHAPMKAVSVGEYLDNPIDNCKLLLHPDVYNDNSYDDVVKTDSFVFNDNNTVALIITTANVYSGTWGTKTNGDWTTPGNQHVFMQGVPSYYPFAVDTDDLSAFLYDCDSTVPQFLQTIQCICFVSSSLLTLGNTFKFNNHNCRPVTSAYKSTHVTRLNVGDFGYDSRFRNIAKLYTYPYARLEISDESGAVTEIRIESTNGNIDVNTCVNVVFPWLKIDAHISTIGRSPNQSISFVSTATRNMPIRGNWRDFLHTWNIPTFGIVQNARTNNDYSTYYDRKQAKIAYDNAYSNVVEMADCTVDNAALQVACNSAVNAANNTCINSQTTAQVSYNQNTTVKGGNFTVACANAEIEAKDKTASISAASAAASAGVGAVSSALSLDVGGAIGSMVNGGVQAGAIMAQNAVAVNLQATQAAASNFYSIGMSSDANSLANDKAAAQVANNNATTSAQNSMVSGTAANSAAAQIANGTRDKNTATNAVTNRIEQAAMGEPVKFGTYANGETSTTRPLGMFVDLVTQDDNSIAYAGNEMLRYGYYLNQQWDFDGNWNVCDRFTYWKLSDFWVKGLNIPDMYVDKIRFFLFGGVTVWRKPEYIGNTPIYENGF